MYHVLKSGSEVRKCRLLQNVSIVMQLCRAVAGSVPLFLYGGGPVPVAGLHTVLIILILAGVYILIERMFLQHHVLDINQLSVFVEQSKQ